MRRTLVPTLVALSLLFCLAAATAEDRVNLDLFDQTLDGVPICAATMDTITDILGRPTHVESNEMLADILGPRIYYHDIGLDFWFSPGRDQTVETASVYFSRAYDDFARMYYSPFPGKLHPRIDANTKLPATVEAIEAAGHTVSTQSPEEARQITAALQEEIGFDLGPTVAYWSVRFDSNGSRVVLNHEEITKFLEKATIHCPL